MAGLSVSQCREGERKGRVALRSYSHSVSQSVQSHASLTLAHQRRSRLEFTALLTVQVGHTLPLTCSLRREFKSLENLSITFLSSGKLSDILVWLSPENLQESDPAATSPSSGGSWWVLVPLQGPEEGAAVPRDFTSVGCSVGCSDRLQQKWRDRQC